MLSLASALISCSKTERIEPNVAGTTDITSSVKVINGRMVFADQKALDQMRNKLSELSEKADGAKALAEWEKDMRFTSLRASADNEMLNLEALQTVGSPTPAFDLVSDFGFPAYISSIINDAGEYQVGGKIYWFHDKIKYQADSESELLLIKQNPSLAKVKLKAGLTNTNNRGSSKNKLENPIATNFVSQGVDPYAANGFTSPTFNLNNDPGSQRRIIYDLHVYAEDDGWYNSVHYFYTALYLQLKYEYYSSGRRGWYPAVGQKFNWQTDLSVRGVPYIQNQLNTIYGGYVSLKQSGSTDQGISSINIIGYQLTSYGNTQTNNIVWGIDGGGTINGYPDIDPAHPFAVSNSSLW